MLQLFLTRFLAASTLGTLLVGCAAPLGDPYYDGPDVYPAHDSGPRAYPSAPPHPYDWRRPQYPKPYYEREEARERERERERERLQRIEHERALQQRREYNERERNREREAKREHEQHQEKLRQQHEKEEARRKQIGEETRQQRERLRESTKPPAPDRKNRTTDRSQNDERFDGERFERPQPRFRDQTPRPQDR
jgi:hypothetical protein